MAHASRASTSAAGAGCSAVISSVTSMPRSRAKRSSANPVLERGSDVAPRAMSLMVLCPHWQATAICGCVIPSAMSHSIKCCQLRCSMPKAYR